MGEQMPEMDYSGKQSNLYTGGLRSIACGSRRIAKIDREKEREGGNNDGSQQKCKTLPLMCK